MVEILINKMPHNIPSSEELLEVHWQEFQGIVERHLITAFSKAITEVAKRLPNRKVKEKGKTHEDMKFQ